MLTANEEMELLKLLEIEEREQIKNKYWRYVEYVHEGRWLAAKHLLFVCDKVQNHIENSTKRILIIQMPPQHGKSQSVTETLPSYFLGKWPYKRVIEVSYGDDLAQRFGRRNKQKIQQFGKELFGIELATDHRSDTDFEISNHKGSMISKGIMSGITGQPGDLVIIDDPVKNRQEADSETYRERMWDEFLNSIYSRQSATAKIILIQTRWHEDDLAGRILKNLPSMTELINIPCEAEDNDILGRKRGEALFPEIGKDTEWLKEFKKAYATQEGNRAWLALYQGRPTAEEGNMIKRHWFRYWKPKEMDLPPITLKIDGQITNIHAEDLPDFWDEQLQSWDCTFKDKEDNDYVSGGTWGRRHANYYLLDLINERMDIVQTMEAIKAFSEKWPKALTKLIEGKANGPAVIQMLSRKLSGIIEVEPEGGKVARAAAVSPALESGNVYIPHPMLFSWVNPYIEQMTSFPQGKNDDMVDMSTQALNRLIYRSRNTQKQEPLQGYYTESELEDMVTAKKITKWQMKEYLKKGVRSW